jgi:hypothetical protein
MIKLTCRCKRGIKFDGGGIFEADKKYNCYICNNKWIIVLDNKYNRVKLQIEGTFKSEFIILK